MAKQQPLRLTHRLKDATAIVRVTAWQYLPTSGIPIWVCRRFHKLSAGPGLTGLSEGGNLVEVRIGDWIMRSESGVVVIMDDPQFKLKFEVLGA